MKYRVKECKGIELKFDVNGELCDWVNHNVPNKGYSKEDIMALYKSVVDDSEQEYAEEDTEEVFYVYIATDCGSDEHESIWFFCDKPELKSARFCWQDVSKESKHGEDMFECMDMMMDDDNFTLSYPIKGMLLHRETTYSDWICDEWINEATKEVMYSEGTARV